MTQISARLDCVENLTRQRHDRDQTENQQNAATVDIRLHRKSPTIVKKNEQDIVDLYVCELAQQSTLVLMFQRYG